MGYVKHVVVIELDNTLEKCSNKPHPYVTYTGKPPEDLLAYLKSGKGPERIGNGAVGLIPKLVSNFKLTRSLKVVQRRLKEVIHPLRDLGYAVNRDANVFSVYVIDSDTENKTTILNVGRKKRAVYVGQSSITPEQRYDKLKHAEKFKRNLSSGVVDERGKGINESHSPKKKVFTEKAALNLEADISFKLHNQGYRVFGGGLTSAIR